MGCSCGPAPVNLTLPPHDACPVAAPHHSQGPLEALVSLVLGALLAACASLQASLVAACHTLQWLAAPPRHVVQQPAGPAPLPPAPTSLRAACPRIVTAGPSAAPAAPDSPSSPIPQAEGSLQPEPSADLQPPTPCSLSAAFPPPSSAQSVVMTPRALPASPFATLRSRMSLESSPCSSVASFSPQESLQSSLRSGALFSSALTARSSLFHPASRQLSAQHQQQDSQLDSGSLNEPLEELLQHRALEDGDLLDPFSPGCGAAAPPPPPLTAAALPAELRPWLVPPEEVELLRRPGKEAEDWVLGEGASGRVVKALLRGQPVAAKQCALCSAEAQEAFVAEALCLLQLSHQNVVALRGLCLDSPCGGTLLLEYCDGRDLHSVLRLQAAGSQERLFSWQRHGRRVARDVARALAYLHSQGVVHMDIKSSNCMLSASGTAKLADLGLARRQTKPAFSQLPPVGTFEWTAPEVLAGGRNCTSAVDIYSFGVLLWEIVTGERPVRGALRMPCPDECPADIADLILACGELNPEERPTAAEVLRRLCASART